MLGVIETLRDTYGFIRGQDRVSYFFLPSCLQRTQPHTFDDLREGWAVRFEGIAHPKGPRAIEVLIIGGGDVADQDQVQHQPSDQPTQHQRKY